MSLPCHIRFVGYGALLNPDQDTVAVDIGNERYDHEYQRNGTCNLFRFFAPLEGWRQVKVIHRRTMIDWAYAVREVVDVYFPAAAKITLVWTI